MENTLQLSVRTLEWAAKKTGRNLGDFARTMYSREKIIENIILGQLTLPQIKKFSDEAKVPFGFLFLKAPPRDYALATSVVDFRTTQNARPLSQDFLEIYKDIEHKQSWYKNYLATNDASPLPFVGRYKDRNQEQISEIARDIRVTLGLDNLSRKVRNADEYFSAISAKCEDVGILVFKNSVVVNNTKRKLNVSEFRGFVISDDLAPAIFINGSDSKYATIFTLAHELAHVWLGDSGVSDTDINSSNSNEIRCNKIAAEVLIPKEQFIAAWDISDDDPHQKIRSLNQAFKVSELVVARVALTNAKISADIYWEIHNAAVRHFEEYRSRMREAEGGPSQLVMLPIKNSRKITKTVVDLVKSNQLGTAEASILLNVSPTRIFSL